MKKSKKGKDRVELIIKIKGKTWKKGFYLIDVDSGNRLPTETIVSITNAMQTYLLNLIKIELYD